MRPLWLAALATLTGCATLDTSAMTPMCRNLYNACLSSCRHDSPQAVGDNSVPPGGTPRGSAAGVPWGDSATPGCVSGCNDRAKTCK